VTRKDSIITLWKEEGPDKREKEEKKEEEAAMLRDCKKIN